MVIPSIPGQASMFSCFRANSSSSMVKGLSRLIFVSSGRGGGRLSISGVVAGHSVSWNLEVKNWAVRCSTSVLSV